MITRLFPLRNETGRRTTTIPTVMRRYGKCPFYTALLMAAGLITQAAMAVLVPNPASAEVIELRVMSFNIRHSKGGLDEAKTENNWTDAQHPRRERAIRVIRDYRPDVLGVQEARALQIADLREALPEYEFYGVGRDDGKTGGEFVGIFYRKDRFDRIRAGSFWLSATPQKPGTTFAKRPGPPPRMASWVRLRDKPSGREMLILNTHWDHISAEARKKSAALIRARLSKLAKGEPAIVMGDLNTPEDSAPLRELLNVNASPSRRLVDSYRKLHPQRSPEESTFNHWKGTTTGSRIDFILHTDEFTPTAAAIVRTNYDNFWPSDHYPVTTTLTIDAR
jgi:endonuclease/exonuclease/phosphatase family metal-dependent hydrolase